MSVGVGARVVGQFPFVWLVSPQTNENITELAGKVDTILMMPGIVIIYSLHQIPVKQEMSIPEN